MSNEEVELAVKKSLEKNDLDVLLTLIISDLSLSHEQKLNLLMQAKNLKILSSIAFKITSK